jgi:hypothetical protein
VRWNLVVCATGVAYALTLGLFALLHVTSWWSCVPLGTIFAVMVVAAHFADRDRKERAEARWAANQNIATKPDLPPAR